MEPWRREGSNFHHSIDAGSCAINTPQSQRSPGITGPSNLKIQYSTLCDLSCIYFFFCRTPLRSYRRLTPPSPKSPHLPKFDRDVQRQLPRQPYFLNSWETASFRKDKEIRVVRLMSADLQFLPTVPHAHGGCRGERCRVRH